MKLFESIEKEGVVTPSKAPITDAILWLEECVKRGRLGPFVETVVLTPALAKVLLDRNEANRKLRDDAVKAFAHDMTNGHWQFNGEPLIVSIDGDLNDGQHRCAAVMRSGVSIKTFITFGVSRESRLTVDQGKVRTVADYLGMDGHQNASALGTALNMILQYRRHNKLTMESRFRATKADQMEYLEKHPTVAESVNFISSRGSNICGGRGLAAFCHWIIWQTCGDRLAVDDFMTGLSDGLDLHPHDPILVCRNRLIEFRGNSNVTAVNGRAELIFRAWNSGRKRQTISTIRIRGELPRIEK